MKHVYLIPAVLLSSAIAATSAVAETPRILTLQGASEAVLPGAHDGAKHGVTVRRGSGFAEPIVIAPPEIVVEEVPIRRVGTKKKKRKSGW